MLRARPKVVMFDLDGTLIDTMFRFADLAAEIMTARHGSVLAEARAGYLGTSGIPFHQQLEVLHPGHGANAEASAEFERRKRAITRSTPMEAPARAALGGLRELECRIVLSSNTGQDFVDEFVAGEEFRFDLALGFDADRAMAKGRPHVDRTQEVLGVVAADILFVGDSLKDADLAGETGTAFVGRLGTFAAADFARHDPSLHAVAELSELVALVAAAARVAA